MRSEQISAKVLITDAKTTTKRFRNILANSGELMESGEKRDLKNLYVMGTDGKLIKISNLNTNPDKQTEDYTVQAQADHGEVVDGYIVPTIEKQFGSCKVWLEEDGLHARMYFAEDDDLANHAWAISEHASYSIGMDWYPEGYFGAGYEITEPIGILREISMVLTGNDPRAKTIDSINADAEAQGSAEADDGVANNKEDNLMAKKLDELTPDENKALTARLAEVINEFTADVPEDETQPTAVESQDDVEAPAEAPVEEVKEEAEAVEDVKEETTDSLKQPIVVVTDKKEEIKQGVEAVKQTDWLYSTEARQKFADMLRANGTMDSAFTSAWRAEAAKHSSIDGISGLPLPVNVEQIFETALEKSDGIISHFRNINTKSFRINLLNAVSDDAGRAGGHKKGDTKSNQSLADTYRDVLNLMVYKKLDLDAMEIYENPEIIEIRAEELVNAIIVEIERAAIIGDGRTEPQDSSADRRMFRSNRGFYSIKADAAAASGFGTLVASKVTPAVGDNLYDTVVKARGHIKTEGRQVIVAKSSAITALLTAKANGQYLIAPGASIEDFLGVERVYTPAWMESDSNDAYLFVDGAYAMIGENGIRTRSDFDTATNTDVLLAETPRGGSLAKYKSAVAIAGADES